MAQHVLFSLISKVSPMLLRGRLGACRPCSGCQDLWRARILSSSGREETLGLDTRGSSVAFMSRVGIRDGCHSWVRWCTKHWVGAWPGDPWWPTLLSHLRPGPPGAPMWDSPEPKVRDKRLVVRQDQAGVWQRKPCSVVCPDGGLIEGQQLKSCKGRVGAWEGTFWKWSQALLASLVQSWREWGTETLPSASGPSHWGGSRVLRGTVLVTCRFYSTTDGPVHLSCPLSTVTGPWKNLTLCQREGKAGSWME